MKGHAASIGRQHIQRAYERIKSYIRETPIVALGPHPQLTEADVVLKLELLQHAGSFKTRGAFNNLLSERVPPAGVIAASGGNHGVAVAFAAQRLGQVAEIFVPMISSPVKIDRIRKCGAKVTIVGANYAEALEASLARATETGARIIHAYDQRATIEGAGTIAMEFEAQSDSVGQRHRAGRRRRINCRRDGMVWPQCQGYRCRTAAGADPHSRAGGRPSGRRRSIRSGC